MEANGNGKLNGWLKTGLAVMVSLLLFGAGVLTAQGRNLEKLDATAATLDKHLVLDALDHDALIELRSEVRAMREDQREILALLKKK